nr:MAG TPA: hypothetical protein [Caudoviricetes sp.]
MNVSVYLYVNTVNLETSKIVSFLLKKYAPR